MKNLKNPEMKFRFVVLALLLASFVYKFPVPSNLPFIPQLEYLFSFIPGAMIKPYNNYLSIVHMTGVGLGLQALILIYTFSWKPRPAFSRFSWAVFLVLALILQRTVSLFVANPGLFGNQLRIWLVVCFAFVYLLGNMDVSSRVLEKPLATMFISLAVISSLLAVVYFYYIPGDKTLSMETLRRFRIAGIFPDAVHAGFFYAIGVFAAVMALVQGRSGGNKREQILYITSIPILIIGGVLSGSRSFLIAPLLLFAYAFLSLNKRWKAILLCLLLILVVFVVNTPDFGSIFENSDEARQNKLRYAIEAFKSAPLLGIGATQFPAFAEQLGGKPSNPHNMPLEILSEHGVLGGFIYLAWGVLMVIRCFRKDIWRESIFPWALAGFVMLSQIAGVTSTAYTILLMGVFTWGIESYVKEKKNA